MNQFSLSELLVQADCLYTRQQVEAALDALVPVVIEEFSDKTPVILGVMNGALPTLGYLLPRLPFLLEVDYVHATRYGHAEVGASLRWRARPEINLQGRHVLLVDDILDRGITLAEIKAFCLAEGAASIKILVLGKKVIAGYMPSVVADYVALSFPDRFVFGYGMDYQGYWRNAPGVYAIRNSYP